jgi:hypothetical protein
MRYQEKHIVKFLGTSYEEQYAALVSISKSLREISSKVGAVSGLLKVVKGIELLEEERRELCDGSGNEQDGEVYLSTIFNITTQQQVIDGLEILSKGISQEVDTIAFDHLKVPEEYHHSLRV